VSEIDKAAVGCARKMGGGTVVMSVLSAETPATSLPKGAFFSCMTQGVLIALKAIWERNLVSPTSLTKYCTAL